MAIRFFCSGCGQKFEVADSMAGRSARCPRCDNTTEIPPVRQPETSPAALDGLPVARPVAERFTAQVVAEAPGPAADAAPVANSVSVANAVPVAEPTRSPVVSAAPQPTIPHPASNATPAPPAAVSAPPRAAAVASPSADEYDLAPLDDDPPAGRPASRPAAPQIAPVAKSVPQASVVPVRAVAATAVDKPAATAPVKVVPVGENAAPGKVAPAKVAPVAGVPAAGAPVVGSQASSVPARVVPASAIPAETVRLATIARVANPKAGATKVVAAKPAAGRAVTGHAAAANVAPKPAPSAPSASDGFGLPDLEPLSAGLDASELDPIGLPTSDFFSGELTAASVEASPSASGLRCPGCRALLTSDSDICVQCGLDFRTGKRIPRPSASAAAGSASSDKGSLRTVRLGLNLMFVASISIGISSLVGMIPVLAVQVLSLLPLGFGVAAGTLASVLCVFVPSRTGALPPIFVKLVLDVASAFVFVAVVDKALPPVAIAAVPFLLIASNLCFIFFMKHLAIFVRRQDVADDAMSLVWFAFMLFLGGIGAGAVALLIPVAGFVVMLCVSLGSIALTFKFGLVVRELAVATRGR